MFGVQFNFRFNFNIIRINHTEAPSQPRLRRASTTETNSAQDPLMNTYTDPSNPAPSAVSTVTFLPPQTPSGSVELLDIPQNYHSGSFVASTAIPAPTSTPPNPAPTHVISPASPVTEKQKHNRRIRSFWMRRRQRGTTITIVSATGTGCITSSLELDASNNNNPQHARHRLFNPLFLRRGLSKITTQFAPGAPA